MHWAPCWLQKLLALAEEVNLKDKINAMFDGEHINNTEDRAVLHVATRARRDQVGFVFYLLFTWFNGWCGCRLRNRQGIHNRNARITCVRNSGKEVITRRRCALGRGWVVLGLSICLCHTCELCGNSNNSSFVVPECLLAVTKRSLTCPGRL